MENSDVAHQDEGQAVVTPVAVELRGVGGRLILWVRVVLMSTRFQGVFQVLLRGVRVVALMIAIRMQGAPLLLPGVVCLVLLALLSLLGLVPYTYPSAGGGALPVLCY